MSALFVVDVSRSMDSERKFPSPSPSSRCCGTLVLDQGDAAGLVAVEESTHYLPARSGHHHLTMFLSEVARLSPSGATSVAAGLARAGALLKRRGVVVAVSDFYDDAEALVEMRRLSRMGHEVVVVQTLSAEELTLPAHGAVEFVDAETNQTLVVQPELAQETYRERVSAWLSGFEAAVRREGLDYLRLSTADVLERELRRFLGAGWSHGLMGITFLQPWAWLLAATVALPIAVHLLARNRSRRMPFPTLRFLEVTKLSAVSRQTLQDVPLLAVRIALVLAAVAALAGPVFVTPAREAAWAGRVARAVVLDDRTAPTEDELRSAAVGASFAGRTCATRSVTPCGGLVCSGPQSARSWCSRHSGAAPSAPAISLTCPMASASG